MPKIMRDLIQKAIDAALNCDWERALDYNLAVLQEDENNLQAMNRLAKAYMELGQKNQAKEIYQKVLSLDPYNQVALKNLRLLPKKNATAVEVAQEDFIEAPGETKTALLIKIASKDVLAELYAKQPLTLKVQGSLVAAYTKSVQKIGCLPDNLSFKIKTLIKKGYAYSACVKAVDENQVTIFTRETKRPKRYSEMPSFSEANNHKNLKS